MGRSKVDRAKRLLDVQNQLLKIEENKAAELKQKKNQLEEDEQQAIEYLHRVDLTSRFAALAIHRPLRVRKNITIVDQQIDQQKNEVLKKNLHVRMAERMVEKRHKQAEREKAEGQLKEITEVVLLRSRFE